MGSLPVSATFNAMDVKVLSADSKEVLDFIAEYYTNIEAYPVMSPAAPGHLRQQLPDSAPAEPEPMSVILDDVRRHIVPGLMHWQSPGFFGFFPASGSTAGIVGEMLCSALNVVNFSWWSSPAAAELENLVIDWMGKLLGLPGAFLFSGGEGGGGIVHGTTSEAVLCTMAAARDRVLDRLGGGTGNVTKLVVYVSDQTHSAVLKASRLVGIPEANFRQIATGAETEHAMLPENLRVAMEADMARDLVPAYVCATVGTTALNASDPIRGVGRVANANGAWLHVDAAYAGSAAICPEFRHYLDGVELADSVSMNTHKWLLTNGECCCLWIRRPSFLVRSLSVDPEYLRNHTDPTGVAVTVNYKDWQLGLSRRFRALKLWVVLRRYGVENLREHIRSKVRLAERLELMVRGDERFELVGRRTFSLVCFRLKPPPSAEEVEEEEEEGGLNRELLEAINLSGRALLTHAKVEGRYFLRAAIGATMTEEIHVDSMWKLIQEKADEVLRKERRVLCSTEN